MHATEPALYCSQSAGFPLFFPTESFCLSFCLFETKPLNLRQLKYGVVATVCFLWFESQLRINRRRWLVEQESRCVPRCFRILVTCCSQLDSRRSAVDRARHWSVGDGVWGNHSVLGVTGGVRDPHTALVGLRRVAT